MNETYLNERNHPHFNYQDFIGHYQEIGLDGLDSELPVILNRTRLQPGTD